MLDGGIGNTPMIKIVYKKNGVENCIYTKLEFYNLTGSIKDRMAYYVMKQAYLKGDLKPGQTIIEATSGNTGISFSAIGRYYGHPVVIFMPDWMSVERQKLMKLYGADVRLVSKDEGGFLECIRQADILALSIAGYRPNQFSNEDNVMAHYYGTGPEISSRLPNVTAFVSGIGTGGTLMGVGKYLKEKYGTLIIAMEPDKLPILKDSNIIGSHKIEGIGDDFIPSLVDVSLIDDIIDVSDMDSIQMSRKLSKVLGLGVGISSGANFLASIMAQEKANGSVVTVFPDDNKKYLSTDLSLDEDLNPQFLSNQIELIGYEIIG